MFSHVFLGISDFDRAERFYTAVLDQLPSEEALVVRYRNEERGWLVWMHPSHDRPLLVIGKPENGEPQHPGNGNMTALMVGARSTVDACWRAALQAGGKDEGAPGLRPMYHENYYGAYFRDLDGNKLCVVCHRPEEG